MLYLMAFVRAFRYLNLFNREGGETERVPQGKAQGEEEEVQ